MQPEKDDDIRVGTPRGRFQTDDQRSDSLATPAYRTADSPAHCCHTPHSQRNATLIARSVPVIEDRVQFSLRVHWTQDAHWLRELLDEARESRGNGPFVYPHPQTPFVMTGKPSWLNFNASWYLQHADFLLALCSPDRCRRTNTPNAFIDISWHARYRGLAQAWSDIKFILNSLGFTIEWTRLTRIDLAIDLVDQPLDPIVHLIDRRQYVSKAKSIAIHRDAGQASRCTGITVGCHDMKLRIYDKLHELAGGRHPNRLQDLQQTFWRCEPGYVTRVEFQMTRKSLKSSGVDTMEDWITNRATVMLSGIHPRLDWFRLLDRIPSKGNQKRTPDHAIWIRLRRLVEAWANAIGADPDLHLTPLAKQPPDVSQVVRQGLSYLITAEVEGQRTLQQILVDLLTRSQSYATIERRQAKYIERGQMLPSDMDLRYLDSESIAKLQNFLQTLPHDSSATAA